MQGQLTGLPRQIKDSVADLYNYLLKWNKLNTQGFSELSDVSNIKLSLFVVENEKQEHVYRYCDDLETACKKLVCTFSELENISLKLTTISEKFRKLCNLNISSSLVETPPFKSWPVSQFAEHAAAIAAMHTKEVACKRCIVEHAAHVDCELTGDDVGQLSEKCRDILMAYSTCWMQQPYINENTRTLYLQGMLFETGHSV